LDSSSQAHTEAGGMVALSYDGTVTFLSLFEAFMISMKAYCMCVFSSLPCVRPCRSRYLFLHTSRIRVTQSRFLWPKEFRVHQRSSPKQPSTRTKRSGIPLSTGKPRRHQDILRYRSGPAHCWIFVPRAVGRARVCRNYCFFLVPILLVTVITTHEGAVTKTIDGSA